MYRLVTSIATRNACFFTFVFSIKFIKSVVSLRHGPWAADVLRVVGRWPWAVGRGPLAVGRGPRPASSKSLSKEPFP